MPNNPTDKSVTVKLGPEWRVALEYFKKHDPNHLTILEQIRRSLICYWVKKGIPDGIEALNFVMPGWEPGDEEFGIVIEGGSDDEHPRS